MVNYFCHFMSLYVCPGDFYLFWIALWPIFMKETILLALLVVFDCVAVAFSASFVPFGAFDGRF